MSSHEPCALSRFVVMLPALAPLLPFKSLLLLL